MSVFLGIGIGCANFATTNNSSLSLYRPTDVAYGWKSEPVTASIHEPEVPAIVADWFSV